MCLTFFFFFSHRVLFDLVLNLNQLSFKLGRCVVLKNVFVFFEIRFEMLLPELLKTSKLENQNGIVARGLWPLEFNKRIKWQRVRRARTVGARFTTKDAIFTRRSACARIKITLKSLTSCWQFRVLLGLNVGVEFHENSSSNKCKRTHYTNR